MSIHTIDPRNNTTPTPTAPANPTWQAALVQPTPAMQAGKRAATLVKEFTWDDVFGGPAPAPKPEPLARQVFRTAVSEIADKAKVALPQTGGRVEAAVKIVLEGDVIPCEEPGRYFVGSQSDPGLQHIVEGVCDCHDADREGLDGWCKHRLASAIYLRATDLASARMAELDRPAAPAPQPVALPEAPASANVYVTIRGRKVQLTLRDTDEARLLARLDAVMAQYPEDGAAQPPAAAPVAPSQPAQPEGWCSKHQCQMKLNDNERGKWWSHKTAEGSWCKGR
jgi:hypothetical protein